MKKWTKKESLSKAMHVIKCGDCAAILSSASERMYLPQFLTCDCEERKGIEQRKSLILEGKELSLAIEDKDTNLRIFKGSKDDNICFRLDKFQQYSAPLSSETVNYITGEKRSIIEKLNSEYGFNRATVEDLDKILKLTSDFKQRACKVW